MLIKTGTMMPPPKDAKNSLTRVRTVGRTGELEEFVGTKRQRAMNTFAARHMSFSSNETRRRKSNSGGKKDLSVVVFFSSR